MKRSHRARKHRSLHDKTEEGSFDSPGRPRVNGSAVKKMSTVKMGLDVEGKASVYIVSAGGHSSPTVGGAGQDGDSDSRQRWGG